MQPSVTIIEKAKNLVLEKTEKKIKVAAYCRVSTSTEDQANSFESQVAYYTEKINQNKKWEYSEIYADEAITGTSASKRPGFLRMIAACERGEIDLILTKSISRFARNTIDTLKYVRKLKSLGIAVFFEEENINTMAMESELVLTMLSSVAQQEVQNISSHVKKGMQMKARKGEVYGCPRCYGYDYKPGTKEMFPNEYEANVVKMIYSWFLEGLSIGAIVRRLGKLKIKTPSGKIPQGNVQWVPSTIKSILSNEKYTGNILLGKSFVADPITKKRVINTGQQEKYLIENHHESIITKEDFNQVQEMLQDNKIESANTKTLKTTRYSMTNKLYCGFCGSVLNRKTYNTQGKTTKHAWQCRTSFKFGKKGCVHSKSLEEKAIEKAFVESLKIIMGQDSELFTILTNKIKSRNSNSSATRSVAELEKEILRYEERKDRLTDAFLDGTILKDDYKQKSIDLTNKLEELSLEKDSIMSKKRLSEMTLDKIDGFMKKIKENNFILEYDGNLFETLVYKVIIGGLDESGNVDPYRINIIYNFSNNLSSNDVEKLFDFSCKWQYSTFILDNLGNKEKINLDSFHVDVSVKI